MKWIIFHCYASLAWLFFCFFLLSDLSGLLDAGTVTHGCQPVSSHPASSCLVKGQRPPDSPSKHVSFNMDKENVYNMGLPAANQQLSGARLKTQKGKHHKHIVTLKERLEKVEKQSDEIRPATNLRYPLPGGFLQHWSR